MNYFLELDKLETKELMKGAKAAFINTENLTIAFTDLKAGVEIPLHHHVEEATDIILEGELQMQVGDTTATLKPGIISLVPSNIPHKAVAVTNCKIVTVLHPRRDKK